MPQNDIKNRFRTGIVLDGGLATELESRGADLRDSLWSARLLVDNPSLITTVHLDYLRAGSDVITSASYQCSFEGFRNRGFQQKEAANIIVSSVALAREAREMFLEERGNNDFPLVAASLGSYGAILADGSEFTGNFNLSLNELIDWHRPRFELLAQSGADLLAFETIPSLKEAEAIERLLETDKSIPAWVSFSCRDGMKLGSGEDFKEVFPLLSSLSNLVGVGINCTSPYSVHNLLGTVSEYRDIPKIVYPNSGEIWDSQSRLWRSEQSSQSFSWQSATQTWWKLGARGIGGCCRTTPKTICEIKDAIRLCDSR